jgi:hypothetical protein
MDSTLRSNRSNQPREDFATSRIIGYEFGFTAESWIYNQASPTRFSQAPAIQIKSMRTLPKAGLSNINQIALQFDKVLLSDSKEQIACSIA